MPFEIRHLNNNTTTVRNKLADIKNLRDLRKTMVEAPQGLCRNSASF
jgi:hypothetical protein